MDSSDTFYSNYYENIFGSGVIGWMAGIAHRFMEHPLDKKFFPNVLELGAGNGQHRKYVRHKFSQYVETDLRISPEEEITFQINSDETIKRKFLNAENLSQLNPEKFDRIIATCLLVHLPNPEKALQEWRRVTKSEGILTIYVPTEPGIALRLFRTVTTKRKASKLGLNHKSIHYREHRNMWIFINLLIYEVFADDVIKRRRFPLPFLTWNLSLFDVYEITKKSNGQ
jgi:SAM-dependent methyltransferase